MVHARRRPGPEVVDGLMGSRPVEFAPQIGAANHAEDLGIHEMGRSVVRIGSQSSSHWLSVGAG